MGLKSKIMIMAMIVGSLISIADASWQEPIEIISGTWGSGNDQFGIEYGDTDDMFPRFTITSDGKFVVRDGKNRRVKVYTVTGTFESIIPYRAGRSYTELTIADSYGFSGDFVGYGAGGANCFHRPDQKVYINFSPTGQLIKTSPSKPLELGVVSEKALGNGQYKVTVKFPDKEWAIIGAGMAPPYMRDVNGNLYSTGGKQAIRWNFCGKELTRLTLPNNKYEELVDKDPAVDQREKVIEEYGEVVVAPNGDVYTWKRTPDKYSIVKWTWQDDPNTQTGPDAPANLTVAASTTGLYLAWSASPQDPGCVSGYEVSRSTTSGGTFSVLTTTDKGVLNYNDTTAEAGTTYYYKLRAKAGNDFSAYTAEASGKR